MRATKTRAKAASPRKRTAVRKPAIARKPGGASKKAAPRRRSPYGWLTPRQAIPRMVKRIVKQFDPERIILFGSQARGDAGPDSDVDLLVVMEVEGSKRELEVQIGVALHGIRIPKDILVTTPEAFAWRRKYTGTIEHPADTEGKVLYART
jgi:predicted nucleotidyltransferase